MTSEQQVYDTFTDAQGRTYVAGTEVPKQVFERVEQLGLALGAANTRAEEAEAKEKIAYEAGLHRIGMWSCDKGHWEDRSTDMGPGPEPRACSICTTETLLAEAGRASRRVAKMCDTADAAVLPSIKAEIENWIHVPMDPESQTLLRERAEQALAEAKKALEQTVRTVIDGRAVAMTAAKKYTMVKVVVPSWLEQTEETLRIARAALENINKEAPAS